MPLVGIGAAGWTRPKHLGEHVETFRFGHSLRPPPGYYGAPPPGLCKSLQLHLWNCDNLCNLPSFALQVLDLWWSLHILLRSLHRFCCSKAILATHLLAINRLDTLRIWLRCECITWRRWRAAMRRAETWLSALRPHYPAAYGSPPCSENAVDGVAVDAWTFQCCIEASKRPLRSVGNLERKLWWSRTNQTNL